jgi:hypothetical protein
MSDNIDVNPSVDAGAVSVATDEITDNDGKITHYPIYKLATGADGEAELVNPDNPIQVQIAKQTHETDSVFLLNEISRKLSILIKYESLLHKVNLEEDL